MKLLSLPALILVLLLPLSAPALAAPAHSGAFSAASPTFTWQGGPLSGGNMVGEPCGTTHQCEDILITVGDAGNFEVSWKASAPNDQGWLSVTLYKSDAEGN